jgi:hypothetical protein
MIRQRTAVLRALLLLVVLVANAARATKSKHRFSRKEISGNSKSSKNLSRAFLAQLFSIRMEFLL